VLVVSSGSVSKIFEDLFEDLPVQSPTRAYLVSVFSQQSNLSKAVCQSEASLFLLFSQARLTSDFATFQDVADWIFFLNAAFEEHLKFASKEFYDGLAQSSYWSCYQLINRKWDLYRELAEDYTSIERQVKRRLEKIKISDQEKNSKSLPFWIA